MSTQLLFSDAESFATPLLTVFAVDIAVGADAPSLPTLLTTSDSVCNAGKGILTSGEFKATIGETLLIHRPVGLKAERLLVVGLGKVKQLSTAELRIAAGTAIRFAKARSI